MAAQQAGMSALVNIRRLRRLAHWLAHKGDLADGDREWLADGLQGYLDRAPDGVTLEIALGLTSRTGWWAETRTADRDEAIREFAEQFSGVPTRRAIAMADKLRRYGTSGWPHDSRRNLPPEANEERRVMHKIFSIDADPPTGWRQIYEIIKLQ